MTTGERERQGAGLGEITRLGRGEEVSTESAAGVHNAVKLDSPMWRNE